jgi:hypothetical protein
MLEPGVLPEFVIGIDLDAGEAGGKGVYLVADLTDFVSLDLVQSFHGLEVGHGPQSKRTHTHSRHKDR